LQARLEDLRAAEGLPDEGPFNIERGGGDAAGRPALVPAVADRGGRERIVGVVDVAAHQTGKRDHLTHRREAPQVPLRPGEGALGVLPVIAQQREGVGLHHQVPAENLVADLLAVVDGGQGEGHLALVGIEPERLRRPARDREIGPVGDPLEVDGRAEAVIPADVVAAQEGAVAGEADRSGEAPVGRELEAAIGIEIAARIALQAVGAGEVGGPVREGGKAGDLIGALFGEVPPLGARHRRDVGKDVGAESQIGIVGDAPVVFAIELEAVDLRHPHIGDEEARCALAVGAQAEAGQRQDARPEQLQKRARENDRVGVLVIGHPPRGDAPARVLGAAFAVGDRAGGVGGVGEDHIAIRAALRRARGEAAPGAQGDEKLAHRAGVEGLGKFNLVGEQLVARLVDHPDVAGGDDFARGAVPDDGIGADRAVFRTQDDIAARSDGLGVAVVAELARLEVDLARRRSRRFAARLRRGRLVLRGERGGSRGEQQGERATRREAPRREALGRTRECAWCVLQASRHGLAYCTARA